MLTRSWLFLRRNGSSFLAETKSWDITERVRRIKMSSVFPDHKQWGKGRPIGTGGKSIGVRKWGALLPMRTSSFDRIKGNLKPCSCVLLVSRLSSPLHLSEMPVLGGEGSVKPPEAACPPGTGERLICSNIPCPAHQPAFVSSLQIFGQRKCCQHGNHVPVSKGSVRQCVGANSAWRSWLWEAYYHNTSQR